MMRLAPRSLYARLVLLLVAGFSAALVLSVLLHARDRDRIAFRALAWQSAQRIADTTRLFDRMPRAKRAPLARELSDPNLRIGYLAANAPALPTTPPDDNARLLDRMLAARLGAARVLAVIPHGADDGGAKRFTVLIAAPPAHRLAFDVRVARPRLFWPARLLVNMGILVGAIALAALVGVRWVTRPLAALADAAAALGENIHRPPLPEDGPSEVRRAARAFNAMQDRLRRYLDSRSRVLAAMSHDLRTPLTRLRLRTEMLDNAELRQKFERDLTEMESMIDAAFAMMRGLRDDEARRPVDIDALVLELADARRECGHVVTVRGNAAAPYPGKPEALRRCLGNLIDNAIKYAGAAEVVVEDGQSLRICVRDRGPGIPPDALERVCEPFYRLEASRSRDSGGVGLGLSIARDLAHALGGVLSLRNRSDGGLEACLALPR